MSPLSELTGQPAVADQIRRILRAGRLPHALLFSGDAGAGKEAAARALAQAVNCTQPLPDDACGRCDCCQRIARDLHPDVHWVHPTSRSRQITIDHIRALERALRLKASAGRVKTGIIVDADCLNPAAANAFLKTLEEPPDHSLIVLLTAQREKLLDTVVSRCRVIRFGTPNAASRSETESFVLGLILKYPPGGSILSVYRLIGEIQQALARVKKDVQDQARQKLKANPLQNLDQAGDYDDYLDRVEDEIEAWAEAQRRRERSRIIGVLYRWHRDLFLAAQQADPALFHYRDHEKTIRDQARSLTSHKAIQNLETLERLHARLAQNVQESLAFEVALLKLA